MNINETINGAKVLMIKAVDHTRKEFSSLHTGKASTSMVEGIMVELYGSQMRIKDIAAITTPDSRTIRIQPWDKESLKPIEKGIIASNVGLNPVVDGMIIRCNVPEMSGERRQELSKVANTMAETGKISIRGVRRDVLDVLKKAQKTGEITEDELSKAEKDVQKLVDNAIADIDKALESKTSDLMKV
ncbi:MAG: ribosome recycling factor [Opitutales bacterium]|nr:ribosome recycling factor [Opitutales bacterium]